MTLLDNPPVIPADTSPAQWFSMCAWYGQLSIAQRMEQWAERSEAIEATMVASIRRTHPLATKDEIAFELARRRFGVEYASAMYPSVAR